MTRPALLLGVLILAAGSGCDRSSPAPPPDSSSAQRQTVTASQRLSWSQSANPAEIAYLRFFAYVDGAKAVLADAVCTPSAELEMYDCSARLPAMSVGPHSLQLSTGFQDSDELESELAPVSPLLIQFVASGSAGALSSASSSAASPRADATAARRTADDIEGRSGRVTTSDGVRLSLELVADGFANAIDLAPTGERLFLVQADGTIRRFSKGLLEDGSSSLAATRGDTRVLSLTADPGFASNAYLYVLALEPSDDGPAYALVRFQETASGLGSAVTLLGGVPASTGARGVVRFGPDGKIYLGLGDGGKADSREDLASLNGKVLRLNPDATTPDDQPAASPVFSWPYAAPSGVAWPSSGALWVVDDDAPTSASLVASTVSSGRPKRTQVASRTGVTDASSVSGLTIYQGVAIPRFQGQGIAVLSDPPALLRFRVPDAAGASISTETISLPVAGPLRALAVADDGVIYVCSTTALYRLRPVRGAQ